ncbi:MULTISPECIES: hypothetical protein [Pseudomonas syringae group]|uniref:Uncharacterized protein n=1 Tax=Pseudomonas syringae pv. persicae TaxID=237306 RepID=A0A3M4A767_9PSED|nr:MULTISPECIES: hypothetical protein [Pseudomonas syringae group]QOQ33543.1 hypothetical protein [Pseudomonas syringae pv. actinidiae]RMP02114.1 hypothetical protein ALQ30_200749 [Pseudomonas syringae pv. persicae]
MTEKTKDERAGELRKTIESIEIPLTAIALLGLLDEFYSKDERKALYNDHGVLCRLSKKAHEKLMSTTATVDPNLSWDARERKYGKEAATEHMRPHMEALEEMKTADLKLTEFERDHPLINRILRMKLAVGKLDYE